MTLWEILKANKTGIAPDMFTMLAASKMNGGRDRLHELSGIPPLSFTAKGKPLTAWSITGNTVQNGTPTPENPVEVVGVGDRTANLFDYKKYFESTFTKYSEYFEFAEIQLKPFTTYTFTTSFSESTIATGVINTAFIITTSTEEPSTLTGGISSTRIATKSTEADGIIKIYKRIRGIYLPKKEDFDSGMHWLMINEGDTALPYEPYGYKIPIVTKSDGAEPITTPIYLPTPLYNGEVMRSDGSRDVKWGVVDLGSLTWENEFGISQGQIRAINISNSIISTMVYGGNCYCQSYMYDGIKKYTEIKNNSIAFSNSKQVPFLRIKNTSYDNVQDLINSLSGVKLYYELAKPTTETFTAPQIPTLNGTTVIDVDTAVKPESMTIKYRR